MKNLTYRQKAQRTYTEVARFFYAETFSTQEEAEKFLTAEAKKEGISLTDIMDAYTLLRRNPNI